MPNALECTTSTPSNEALYRIEQRKVKRKLIRISVVTIIIGLLFIFWEVIEIVFDPVVKVYAGIWGGFTLCFISMCYALRCAITANLTIYKVQTHRGCMIMSIILSITLLAVCIVVFTTARVIPQVDAVSFTCNIIRIVLCGILCIVTILHYRVTRNLMDRLREGLSAPPTISESVIVSNVPGTMVIGGFEFLPPNTSNQFPSNVYDIAPPSYMDIVRVQEASQKPKHRK